MALSVPCHLPTCPGVPWKARRGGFPLTSILLRVPLWLAFCFDAVPLTCNPKTDTPSLKTGSCAHAFGRAVGDLLFFLFPRVGTLGYPFFTPPAFPIPRSKQIL